MRGCVINERVVQIVGDSFSYKRRGRECVSSLLSALRHIASPRLGFEMAEVDAKRSLQPAALSTLQRFTKLRSLELHGIQVNAVASLVTALDSLPLLTSLKLCTNQLDWCDGLIPTSHRLCGSQLDHVMLSRRLLCLLVQHGATMPRLRSLIVFPAPLQLDERRLPIAACDPPFHGQFPSLLHLYVGCAEFLHQLQTCHLPPLSSSSVDAVTAAGADLSHISTRTFRLRYLQRDRDLRSNRNRISRMLTHPPRIRQLVVSDSRASLTQRLNVTSIFPPAPAAASVLSSLTYLDFTAGVALADLHYLLSPSSPPVFAAQLIHLALRVHWKDKSAAASLLPSLPSMYPALTHAHVGSYRRPNSSKRKKPRRWDAAVRTLRRALGAVWCSNADVVGCREDVPWRRSMDCCRQRISGTEKSVPPNGKSVF